MTGYGIATVETETFNVTAELKTLNSKFLDIYCRIPKNFSEKELEIRNLLTQELERGKAEFTLTIQQTAHLDDLSVVNRRLVKAYFNDLKKTALELEFEPSPDDLLRLALQMPNAYAVDTPNESKKEHDWVIIRQVIDEAVKKCNEFRQREGRQVEEKFRQYINIIQQKLIAVQEQDVVRIPMVRERLEKNVKELKGKENFDQNRFEQELIYFIEKFDISEEKTRLSNHLDYFIETLSSPESNGKKLNFISQEIGREVNTIGSKANDAVIQRLVVEMKDELEKIKEQTLNVI